MYEDRTSCQQGQVGRPKIDLPVLGLPIRRMSLATSLQTPFVGALALLTYSVPILLALLLPLQRLAGPELTCIASESLLISHDKALIIHPFRLEWAFVHHRIQRRVLLDPKCTKSKPKAQIALCKVGDLQSGICSLCGRPSRSISYSRQSSAYPKSRSDPNIKLPGRVEGFWCFAACRHCNTTIYCCDGLLYYSS